MIRYVFLPPVEGEYTFELTHLYDVSAAAYHGWETGNSWEKAGECMRQCGHTGKSVPCMNACDQIIQAPILIDSSRTWYLGRIHGKSHLVGIDDELNINSIPICGVDTYSNMEGYWINISNLCSNLNQQLTMECRNRVIFCGANLMSIVDEVNICKSDLVWRPIRCRHYVWTSSVDTVLLEPAQQANINLYSSKLLKQLRMLELCGSSQTNEITDRLHQVVPDIATTIKMQEYKTCIVYGAAALSTVVMGMGDTLYGAGALLSSHPLHQVLGAWNHEHLMFANNRIHDGGSVIVQLTPATHPYVEHPFNLITNEELFHGRRGWITLFQTVSLNKYIIERFLEYGLDYHVTSRGTKFLVYDEYSLTLPLRGFQPDALHWNSKHNPILSKQLTWTIDTIVNTLFECIIWQLGEEEMEQ